MKRIPLISILLFIVLFSCDIEEIPDSQSESFVKFYGAGLNDKGVKVITTENGYVILANIENPGRGMDICLIQTDKFGNSIAPAAVIGGAFDDEGNVIKAIEGGYVIGGYTRETDYADKDIYLVQIDLNDPQNYLPFTRKYDLDNEIYDLIVKDSGIVVATGYTDSLGQGLNMLLLEADIAEDTLFSKGNLGTPNDEVAYAIAPTQNEYIIMGYQRSLTTTSGVTDAIWGLRWAGGSAGFEVIGPNIHIEGSHNVRAKAIAKRNNNEYYVACDVTETGSNITHVEIIKMDIEGHNIMAENKAYGEYSITIVNELKLVDNTLYLCGTSSANLTLAANSQDTRGYMFILRTGIDGSQPVYHYSGDGTTFTGNGFDLTADGGFILTGATYVNQQSSQSAINLCKIRL